MVHVEEFKAWHLRTLIEESQNRHMKERIKEENMIGAEQQKLNFSIFSDNQLLFCGGIVKENEDVSECWAMFHHTIKQDFRAIHNCVKRYFEMYGTKLVKARVKTDFKNGHRWIKLLGFKHQGPFPGVPDFDLYTMEKVG